MGETEDYAEDIALIVHSPTHESGGTDEVNVADLSGELADDQPAKAHALGGAKHSAATLAELNSKVSDATLDDAADPRDPQAHATSHESGGTDELDISGLDPKLHALTHKLGGSDEIDVSGLVHTSVCRASLSANQDILNITPTKVALDVADIDRNSDFDTVNNKFVVPSTGVYLLFGQIHWSAMVALKHITVSIRKNAATQAIMDGHTAFTTAFGLACFTVASLTAGDDITLYAYQSTGATKTLYSGVNRTQLIVVRLY